jgi:hypothetical protein
MFELEIYFVVSALKCYYSLSSLQCLYESYVLIEISTNKRVDNQCILIFFCVGICIVLYMPQ